MVVRHCAGVARAAPGVDADAEAAAHRRRFGVAARMPELLPVDELGGLLQLVAILSARGV